MIESIGFAAGFLMASTMLPQIIKSIKTKSVEDISFYMIIIYMLSSALFVIYGILISSMPVAMAYFLAFCVSTIQLVLKIKYENKKLTQHNES